MIAYGARRLAIALVVAWLALTLAFVALRWVPGDAVDATLGRAGLEDAELDARRDELGFNDPVWRQYLVYLGGLVRGDWGESLVSGQPVRDILAQNLGPTAVLAISALIVAAALGLALGVVASLARARMVRAGAQAVISLALSTPVYWTATLAIFLFSAQWGLLPGPGGRGLRYLVLPMCVLGFHTAGSIAQVTASSVREAAGRAFVRTARAKGLPPVPDVVEHILRVGLLPVIAVVALQLGFLLSGTVITEMIFVRRGLGRVLLQAVNNRDYPVIQGVVVLSAVVYSLANALADVLSALADPRVTGGEG
ncbi:MAG: ABC transporter permease [Chloroflexi bacterium]|nr:ABC transporter permease [Chloroflexota bacterium]